MKRTLCSLLFAVACILGCGARNETITVTGRIVDRKSMKPLGGAIVHLGRKDSVNAVSDSSGFYLFTFRKMPEQAITIETDRYRKVSFRLEDEMEMDTIRRDAALERVPDTAYTALGPVDASFFLSDSLLRRKKLSKNEARRIVMGEITGGHIVGSELIREGSQLLWIFDIQHGKDLVTVMIDAYSGKIVRDEGPGMDKRSGKKRGSVPEDR